MGSNCIQGAFAASSNGGLTTNLQTATTDTEQSISGTDFSDLTSFSKTCDGDGSGHAIVWYGTSTKGSQHGYARWSMATDGDEPEMHIQDTDERPFRLYAVSATLNSQVIKAQARCAGASASLEFQVDDYNGNAYWLELS